MPTVRPALPEPFDVGEVGRHGRLAHPLETSAAVRDVEADELDPCFGCSLGGGKRRLDAEVVELADRCVAGGAHLAVRARVELGDRRRRLALGLGEHRLAPRPEITAGCAPAEGPLERVAVDVDESRERGYSRHGRRH